MPVSFYKTELEFHLYNQYYSYIIKVLKNGHIGQLYFGKKVKDKQDNGYTKVFTDNYDYLLETSRRAMAVCTYPDDMTFSLEHLKQEYPIYGNGDMHSPALDLLLENGSRLNDFVYIGHDIIEGKPDLHPLPHIYGNKDEFTTLVIYLADLETNITLNLYYAVANNSAALMRYASMTNHSNTEVQIDKMMSLNLDLPDSNYEMIELTGAWSRERAVKTRPLDHGITAIQSIRGNSSNNFNPFIALKRKETTEFSGEAIGVSFIYSGNFLAQVEVDTYEMTRIQMGINPQNFSWILKPNETFQTPEAVLVYSDTGLNGMSQTFHHLYTHHLARGYWKDKPRPILINNWEATYFDFNEEKILKIAKVAKDIGVELFVLDDGWFGKRNDDTTSLGDWYTDLNKLPLGIAHLSKEVTKLGLKFGLWFEPEMVNEDSDLFRAHPEWRLATPNRMASQGRHQFILDFSNKDVVDYIYHLMYEVLAQSDISYVKWDMNRCMSEVYSSCHEAKHQGEIMHRYILGVYDLYDRLTTNFPHILFESCSSGGARFDPGMLYYAPQAWTSDDTDAVERLKIQYGTSYVYPISSMGSHVSASPNHQLDRHTSLKMRGDVAYFGTFGYELDFTKLSSEELEEAKEQIKFMKAHRELIQYGTFYRLRSPFENNITSWMVVSEDQKEAIVGWYRVLSKVNIGYDRIKLYGLNEDFRYSINGKSRLYGGDELMNIGLITSDHTSGEDKPKEDVYRGDFTSRIFHLEAK